METQLQKETPKNKKLKNLKTKLNKQMK